MPRRWFVRLGRRGAVGRQVGLWEYWEAVGFARSMVQAGVVGHAVVGYYVGGFPSPPVFRRRISFIVDAGRVVESGVDGLEESEEI